MKRKFVIAFEVEREDGFFPPAGMNMNVQEIGMLLGRLDEDSNGSTAPAVQFTFDFDRGNYHIKGFMEEIE